jgi:PAS domain S-box-containing protein
MAEPILTSVFRKEHRALSLAAGAVLCVLPAILFLFTFMMVRDFSVEKALRADIQADDLHRRVVQTVFSLIRDAETGQRGYLLTGEPRYLKPYDDAVSGLPAELAALHDDHTGSSAAKGNLKALAALTQAKLAELAETIQDKRVGQGARALAIVRSDHGQTDMERIRALEKVSEDDIAQRVATQTARADGALQRTVKWGRGLAVVFAATLLGACFVVLRSFRHSRRLFAHLQEVATRQTAILDSAVDAIITLNPSGTVETINAAGERLFGYSSDALARRDVRVLLDLDLPSQGIFLSDLGLKEHGNRLIEGVGKDQAGRRFPVDIAFGPMELEGGVHVVAIIRDISERKRVEAMKDSFISAVSHELRTPLTSITGSLGLLHGGAVADLPEGAKRLIGIAHANSERLGRLVNDILDIEKIQSGQAVFANTPFDLRAVFRKTAQDLEGYLGKHDVKLVMPDDDRPIWAMGDADRVGQVAANLIANAAKFSPPRGVVRIGFAQAVGMAQASVSDMGPGIPEAFRASVFTRFAQADNSDTRQGGGTGLGLAISKEIVDRLGGRLFFKTELGKGSRFFVNLPSAASPSASAPAVSAVPSTPLQKLSRILICEDDLEMGEFLKALVKAEGGEAELVHSLTQARTALAQGGYAGALLDINLPDGSGLDFLKSFKPLPGEPPLPVVIVSGEERRNLKRSTMALEVVDWVQKPVSPSRMRQSLRSALDLSSKQAAAARPTILHIEDDPDILSLVGDLLGGAGNLVQASTIAAAKHALATSRPRVVILDVGLLDGSGLSLLPFITDEKGVRIPTIVFSAQDVGAAYSGVDLVLTKSRASLGKLAMEVDRLLGDHTAPPQPVKAA